MAVLLMLLTSTLVLRFAYRRPASGGHLHLLDALYFTVETISTVGFGDFSFSGQSQWLEAFGVLLILLGAAVVTTLFTLITNMLVSRRIEQSLGRGRVTGVAGHTGLMRSRSARRWSIWARRAGRFSCSGALGAVSRTGIAVSPWPNGTERW